MSWPIRFTWFPNRTRPAGFPMAWDDEAEMIRAFERPTQAFTEKNALPLWSAATFREHKRASERVELVTALVFDVDEPTPDAATFSATLTAALPGVRWLAHSSFSSVPGALRWRVVVLMSRALTADEHRIAWPLLAASLETDGVAVDAACKDASRAWYWPAVPPCGVYEHASGEGDALDVNVLLQAAAMRREAEEARRREEAARRLAPARHAGRDVVTRARAYLARVPGAVSGQHGHDATFLAALKVVLGFNLDEETAFSLLGEWNATCRPPWSERDLRRKCQQAFAKGMADAGFLIGGAR